MKGKIAGNDWAAFVAGAGIICYALFILVVSLFSITRFQPMHLLLLPLGLTMIILGIGLIRHNYYAWFLTSIFVAIKVLMGFAGIIAGFMVKNSGFASGPASRILWPVIFLWLLYVARKECRSKILPWEKEERTKLALFIKNHLPELAATVITLVTASAGFSLAGGVMIIFGLPILAFEFAIIYLVAAHLQKMRIRKLAASE